MSKPKLRFPQFTDDWEQRKLGDLFNFRYGMFNNNPSNGGQYPVYGAGGIQGGYTEYNAEDSVIIGHMGDAGCVTWGAGKHFVTYNGTITTPKSADFDSKYGYYLLSFMDLRKLRGGSGLPFLTYNMLQEMEAMISTSPEEREAISSLLSNLDNLITLHQRKLDALKQYKKGMLQKMFPKNGSAVPEIRFPGFTDDWEQRKLGELVQFSKGTGYSKGDLKDAGTPIILYGRLYTKYETVIAEVDTFADAKAGSVYSRGGEVIVPASGETAEDISIASVVEQSGVLLGSDLNIIAPSDNLDSAFLAISISNGKPHYDMTKMAQGKSVVHLHNSDLEKIELIYPSHDEQSQISTYFKFIDNLITLHQRKIDLIKKYKKGLLQQMFV